ncbi:MAG: hypothetical protein SPH93_14700 [Clostridium sp.]|uniref:hypothetical protein n=1 Tax=Clostridium sp. TaxID=1506 RepID=UPI002A912D15|nr:hypothetical protein [Clostridium sp.]MDY6228883.1 hypothetical protein [Clostridium sp.]
MNVRDKMLETYNKYDKEIREAHMKIVQIEKIYKNKTRKENENIIESILEIIEEVTNDN